MSTPEDAPRPSEYSEELGILLNRLNIEGRDMKDSLSRRGEIVDEIDALIREHGVTEETKFIIAGFRAAPYASEKRTAYIERLRGLEEVLMVVAGETVAWLTREEEVMSHPFNPAHKPQTRQSNHLHLGILPQDPRLQVSRFGEVTIPIEKSVAIELIGLYMKEDVLTLDNLLIPVQSHFSDEPSLELTPEINISSYSNEPPFPVMFGNNKVEQLFDTHNLENYSQVTNAIETLTSALV